MSEHDTWLLVSCEDADDQQQLRERLEAEGHIVLPAPESELDVPMQPE